MSKPTSIKSQYQEMSTNRAQYLENARKFASWTLPGIISISDTLPATVNGEVAPIYEPKFDSIGAEAVNYLANKITLALFPAMRPFFRLAPQESSAQADLAKRDEQAATQLSSALREVERVGLRKFNKITERADLTTTAMHLIVTGNALYVHEVGNTRMYDMSKYVVQRDISGGVLKIIIREGVAYQALTPEQKDLLVNKKFKDDDVVELYTMSHWDADQNAYVVTQALDDVDVPVAVPRTYSKDELPFIPLTWQLTSGEHYGRGMVEMYKGAFASVNALSREMTILGIASAKVVFLVNPGATTLASRIDELNECESGTYFIGLEDDLAVSTVNKMADAQIVQAIIADHSRLIQRVFLMDTAVQRDAERVTAEEIRRVANQLETSFGGVYSRLSRKWQRPLAIKSVTLAMAELGFSFEDETWIDIEIVTGLESISRSAEVDDLLNFLTALTALQQLDERTRMRLEEGEIIRKIASGYNVDTTSPMKVVKSDEEYAAAVEQEQQQALTLAAAAQQGEQ